MKISLEWLGDFLPGSVSTEVAAEVLTHGGFPVEDVFVRGDDTVLDVEVTSNRSDCLSHLGVARELAALLNRELKTIEPTPEARGPDVNGAVNVTIEADDLCPHYTARLIRGVTVGPSPDWMVRRLESIGLRAINNIVDVTNYVLMETGQPLHAFDFAKLDGAKVVVRRARAGETLRTIDQKDRKLEPDMLVIADATKPIALAGVMGGFDTETTGATVDVLLESARFDPLSVRKTSRRLGLASDSSYRFERGLPATLPKLAADRACELILETAGGTLSAGFAEAGLEHGAARTVSLRPDRLRRLLGTPDLADATIIDALSRLGFSPRTRDDRVVATVPAWRLDIGLEVDLIEEVARVVGYDSIPTRPELTVRLTPADPKRETRDLIRRTLAGAGYFEAMTVAFVSDALAGPFTPEGAALLRADRLVRKADAHLQPSVLPGLLETVRRNERLSTGGSLFFQIAGAFHRDKSGNPVEHQRLAIVGRDVREVRGTVETLLERLDVTRSVDVVPDVAAGFDEHACGRIEWSGNAIGHLGLPSRGVIDALGLRETPAMAELDYVALVDGSVATPTLKPSPQYPAVERDLSFVVPEPVHYREFERIVAEQTLDDLERVEHVATYRGKPLAAGEKSVTLKLVFRSDRRTLTADELEPGVKRVVDTAIERVGAQLRT